MYSMVDGHTDHCKWCPLGGICNGGYHMDAQEGYWHYEELSITVYKCALPGSCPGNITASCNEGYEDRTCGVCAPGFTKAGGKCLPCDGDGLMSTLTLYGPGAAFLILAVLGFVYWTLTAKSAEVSDDLPSISMEDRRVRKMKADIADAHLEEDAGVSSAAGVGSGSGMGVIGIEMKSNEETEKENEEQKQQRMQAFAEALEIDENIEADLNAEVSFRDANKMRTFQGMCKILIGYIQIIALLRTSMPGIPWPDVANGIGAVFSFAVFDIVQFIPMGCLGLPTTYITKFTLAVVSIPIGALILYIPMRYRAEKIKTAYLLSEAEGKTHTARIQQELYEQTRDEALKGPLFVCFLLYPTVSLSVLSVFNCRFIEDGWFMVGDVGMQCFTGAWMPLSAFAAVATLIYPVGIPLCVYTLIHRNRHNLDRSKFLHRMGFLYEQYNDDSPMGDVVEMTRKLSLTSAVMFLSPGTNVQIGGALFIAYIFLVNHLSAKPYYDEAQNNMMSLSLVGVCVTLFCGGMLKAFECKPDMAMSYDVPVFTAAILLSNATVVVYMVWQILIHGLCCKAVEAIVDTMDKNEKEKKRLDALTNAALMIEAEEEVVVKKKKKVKKEIIEAIPTITPGVDLQAVFDELDLESVVEALLSSDEITSIAQRGRISEEPLTVEEKEAALAKVTSSLTWWCDTFEGHREGLQKNKSQKMEDAVWPPETIKGLKTSSEVVELAYFRADEKCLSTTVEKLMMEGISDVVTAKFPNYGPEVVEMKTFLRSVAQRTSKVVMTKGVGTFKSEIDRIHLASRNTLMAGMEPLFYASAQDVFDRCTADGQNINTDEELRNVFTAIEYKFRDYLSMPVEKEEIVSAAAKACRKVPLCLNDFLDWFNFNFRSQTFDKDFYKQLRGAPPNDALQSFGIGMEFTETSSETADSTLMTTTEGGTKKAKSKIQAARKNVGAAMKKAMAKKREKAAAAEGAGVEQQV